LLRSNVIRRELERTRSSAQKNALLGDFLELVSIANDEKVLGIDTQHTDPYGGLVTTPLVSDVQDERPVERLHKELNLPIPDAQHLAQAISNGADVFLTRDEEHFISQRQIIETQSAIAPPPANSTISRSYFFLG
jgi:predicted nucleic acid-binding protein